MDSTFYVLNMPNFDILFSIK